MGKRSDEWSKCRRGEKIETRRPNKRVQSDAAAGSGARLGAARTPKRAGYGQHTLQQSQLLARRCVSLTLRLAGYLSPGLSLPCPATCCRSHALQQDRGRLVTGVLGDELAFKGAFEHRLPQPPGAFEVGLDGGFQFLDDGQAAFDFGDDALLFGEGREGEGLRVQVIPV